MNAEQFTLTSFKASLKNSLTKQYATFKGKSSKFDFLSFFLFSLVYYAILWLILSMLSSNGLAFAILFIAAWVFITIPYTAVCVRRLRDARQTWMWAIVFQLSILTYFLLMFRPMESDLARSLIRFGFFAASFIFLMMPSRPEKGK